MLACDGRYAMPLATALASLVAANSNAWPLEVHVLTDGFSKGKRQRVVESLPKGSASIRWIAMDLKRFKAFSTLHHISAMTFARLVIPDLFPETVSTVLYLDADILVLGNLAPLWKIELAEAVVGAVADAGLDGAHLPSDAGSSRPLRVRRYFNAGVLLINLSRWRRERITERALSYLVQHSNTPFADQDALNVACDKLWKDLGQDWNFQGHLTTDLAKIDPVRTPRIVHFVTAAKPWNVCAKSRNAAFYDGFRSRTLFARTQRGKLWEGAQLGWEYSKRLLKRSATLRAAWSYVSGRPAG